jgi:hypothetical protein
VSTIIAHCVPLPEPGPPKTNTTERPLLQLVEDVISVCARMLDVWYLSRHGVLAATERPLLLGDAISIRERMLPFANIRAPTVA